MNKTIIAVAVSAAVVVASGYANAGSYESHFGGQEGVNRHLQGSINDMQDFDHHLQGSINDDRKRISQNEQDIANNTAWNDRQEGVIRQNRGRLDENDAHNQRQDDSIDNAHARIGGVKDQTDTNRNDIGDLQSGQVEQDKRISSNSDGVRSNASRIEAERSDSIERDNHLGGRIDTVDSDSRSRDAVIAGQVNHNEQVNAAYRRQSAAQFAQHGAAIESNSQAIANERNERKEQGKDLNAGVASALAAAGVQMDPNYRGLQMSIAGGAYRGESAAHLSMGAAVTDSVFVNGGVSHDSRGHTGFNASANFRF